MSSTANERARVPFLLRVRAAFASVVLVALALAAGCSRDDPFEVAQKQFQSGDYRGAIERFERFLKEHPDHTRARIFLGRAYTARRDYARARSQFARVRERDPEEIQGYYWDADAALDEGKVWLDREDPKRAREAFKSGVETCLSALRIKGDNYQVWELQATLHLNQFFTEMAASRILLKEGYGSDQTGRHLRSFYEAIYSEESPKKINEGIAELRRSGFAEVDVLEANVRAAKLAFDQTVNCAQHALSLNTQLSNAALALAQLHKTVGQKAAAIAECKQLLAMNEDEARDRDDRARLRRDKIKGTFLLSEIYAKDDKAPDAISQLEELLKRKELPKADEIEARARLSELYYRTKRFDDMGAQANALHKLDRNHAAGNVFRGIKAAQDEKRDAAIEWLRLGLTGPYEEFADGFLILARALNAQKDKGEQALSAISRCLKAEPDRKDARLLRAEIFVKIEWTADAKSEFEALLRESPADVDLQKRLRDLEERAIGRRDSMPAPSTIAEAEAALARDKSVAWLRSKLVDLLLSARSTEKEKRTKEVKRALEEARMLVAEHSGSYLAQRAFGRALLASGDHKRAERAFSQAITLQPLLPECYADLGRALLQQGKFARGQQQLRLGLRRDPKSVSITADLATMIAVKGRPKQARKLVASLKLKPKDPKPPEIQCVEGEIALAEGDARRAQRCFRAVLETEPTFALPHYGLARANQALGDGTACIDRLRQFLENSDGDVDLVAQRQAAYRMLLRAQLDTPRAETALGDVLATIRQMRENGDSGGTAAVLARYYFERGDPQVALAHCRFGLAGAAEEADLHVVWGNVAARAGNTTKAAAEWTKALKLDPTLSEAYLNLAESYRLAGASRLAAKTYQKALRTRANPSDIFRGLALLLPTEPAEPRQEKPEEPPSGVGIDGVPVLLARPETPHGALDRMQATIVGKMEKGRTSFGVAAFRARIALLKGDASDAIQALDRVTPFALPTSEREALALLYFASGASDATARAFDSSLGPDGSLDGNAVRTQLLALGAIERSDLAAAESACESFLRDAAASEPVVETGDVSFEGAELTVRGTSAVQTTLACVRAIQGRTDDAIAIVQEALGGDDRRDVIAYLRLIGAHPEIARAGALHLARFLAFQSSPFTLGLAVPEAKALKDSAPGDPLPYVLLANLHVQRGERREADRLLNHSVVRNSNHGPSFVRRARLLAEDGKVKEAWLTLMQAAEACPDSVDVQASMASLATRARKQSLRAELPSKYWDAAIRIAVQEEEIPSRLAELHRAMARSLRNSDRNGALQHAREACRLAPKDFKCRAELARLLAEKRNVDTDLESLANELVTDFPTRPEGHLLLARIQKKMERLDAAQMILDVYRTKVDPFSVPILEELANVHAAIGDAEAQKRLDSIQNAIVLLDPSRMDVHVALAERARSSRDLEEAQAHLREALLFKPDDHPLLTTYLKLAIERGDYREASRVAERARSAYPNDPEIRKLAGHVFHKLGLEREAMVEYLSATELNPQDAQAHFGLAEVYLAREMLDEARTEARQAYTLDPKLTGASELLEKLDPGAPSLPQRRKRGRGAASGEDDGGGGRTDRKDAR